MIYIGLNGETIEVHVTGRGVRFRVDDNTGEHGAVRECTIPVSEANDLRLDLEELLAEEGIT